MSAIPGRYCFGSPGRYGSDGAATRAGGGNFGRLGCFSRDVDIGPSEVANHAIIGNDMDVRILTQRREGAKKTNSFTTKYTKITKMSGANCHALKDTLCPSCLG